MYAFKCKDVIDHGHCSTTLFETEDGNSRMTLYIYKGHRVPAVGETVQVELASTAPDEGAAPVAPLHVPTTVASVPSNECGRGQDLIPADGSKAPADT